VVNVRGGAVEGGVGGRGAQVVVEEKGMGEEEEERVGTLL